MSKRQEEYTPGPWRFWRHVNEKYPEMSQTAVFGTGDKKFVMIAQMHDDGAAAPEQAIEEIIANARLISTAPEMFEMLKSLLDGARELLTSETVAEMERILKKAKGE